MLHMRYLFLCSKMYNIQGYLESEKLNRADHIPLPHDAELYTIYSLTTGPFAVRNSKSAPRCA